VSFGAAFFIVFGHVVLQAILQPEFIASTRGLIPILAIAFAFATMRNLVPADGPQGAAIALMVACVVACVAFMVLGRRWYRMPIDLTALGVMPSLAILFVFGAHMTGELLPGHTLPLVVDAVVFGFFGAFAIHHFGLLRLPSAEIVGERITVP
jgi:uncharacterized membrane protein (UPF0136 family)